MTRRPDIDARRASRARGFTLLETTLALVLGSMVLLVTIGVFGLMARAEGVLGRRYDRVGEMAAAQFTLRRAMLTFVMAPNDSVPRDENGNRVLEPERGFGTTQDEEDQVPEEEQGLEDVLPARDRIILEPDPLALDQARAWGLAGPNDEAPQRFEVVLMSSPLPDVLLGPGAGWATDAALMGLTYDSAEQAESDSGGVRGVFELRIDGTREALMSSVGLTREGWSTSTPEIGSGEPVGWTLWWRELSDLEVSRLRSGLGLEGDEVQTTEGQARLARAAPLARGLSICLWTVFVDRLRVYQYRGIEQQDLPAYLELDTKTLAGTESNWMFEIGWVVGADPSDENDGGGADGDGGSGGEGDGAGGAGDGGGDGAGGNGAGPGGTGDPGIARSRRLLQQARDTLGVDPSAPVPPGAGGGPGGGPGGGNETGGPADDRVRAVRRTVRLGGDN